MTYGSVVATFYVYEDFYSYTSGIYQHTTGNYVGMHAVRITGWGTYNGVNYWEVANSWGTNWGESGWFYIVRGTNDCSFENDIVATYA
jgi:cathepsin B